MKEILHLIAEDLEAELIAADLDEVVEGLERLLVKHALFQERYGD